MKLHLLNEEITNKQVKLIRGSFTSFVSLEAALDIADDEGLDLVEMSVVDGVSVCKIMNYSKYLYEQKKAKKQTKQSTIKEIKFGCNIADHDLGISAKKAVSILNEGDKVKIIALYKGRNVQFIRMGKDLLERFYAHIPESEEVVIVKEPTIEGYMYTMLLDKKK